MILAYPQLGIVLANHTEGGTGAREENALSGPELAVAAIGGDGV